MMTETDNARPPESLAPRAAAVAGAESTAAGSISPARDIDAEIDEAQTWMDTLCAAHRRSRANGLGYAFAVKWPTGICTVEDRKPLVRSRDMRVVECRADREVLT